MAKQILMIGIGQLGCSVAERFWRANSNPQTNVRVWAVDTDERTTEKICGPTVISMADPCLLGDALDELDNDVLKEWFPCDKQNDSVEFFECLSMNNGSNQWRMKALLSFTYFLSKPKNLDRLHKELDDISYSFDKDDNDRRVDVLAVASLAGGTGSGLLLPLSLYIVRCLEERGISAEAQALVALPEICEQQLTAQQTVKARANAYATLRELNAINLVVGGAHPNNAPKIGDVNDPYLGLLFDPVTAQGSGTVALPFKQIYLFRRNPGVLSISMHIDFLTDAARHLCAEESITTPNTPDAVFSGLSISRSIYPADSIVSYISLATLYNTASEQWSYLYRETAKELVAQRSRDKNSDAPISDNPAESISRAVMTVANRICKDNQSDSALLNRYYDDPADDTAPLNRYPDEFPTRLMGVMKAELVGNDTRELDHIIDLERQRSAKERSHNKKISKLPSRKRKKSMERVACRTNTLLTQLYARSISLLSTGLDTLESRIFGDDEAVSITENILKDNGKPVHPAIALIRLCDLYQTVVRARQHIQSENGENYKKASSLQLPRWVTEADSATFMNCPYDIGTERFAHMLMGSSHHVKGRRDEESLFYYDLRFAYFAIKNAYLNARSAQLLDILGKQITFYYNQLKSILSQADELATDVNAALHAFTPDCSSFYYFVGASEQEKKAALAEYRTHLKQSKLLYAYEAEIDRSLGAMALELNPAMAENSDENEQSIRRLIPMLTEQCYASGFFAQKLDRNILDVIMSQNGKGDADTVELALSKALLPRCLPLLYVVPDSRKNFPEALVIKNTTLALFPRITLQYIADNPGLFEQRSGISAINELLFRAGEYEADTAFSDSLSPREINVCRKISNLKPAYIEAINEQSEDPAYYRSYLKAQTLHQQQDTEMWDPHLLRGLSAPGALPPIYSQPQDQTLSTTQI